MTKTAPKAPSALHLEKRQALLDIALECFIKNGLNQTSVNDIIQNAGIAKGTFYHYFPSKEALILELRGQYMQSFFQVIEQEMGQKPDKAWGQKLQAWFTGSAKHFAEHREMHNALFHQNHQIEDTQDRERIIRYLEDFLKRGISAQAWKIEAPDLVAKLMYHGMHIALDESNEHDYKTLKQESDKLYRIFQAML